jgi:hypothetical protein
MAAGLVHGLGSWSIVFAPYPEWIVQNLINHRRPKEDFPVKLLAASGSLDEVLEDRLSTPWAFGKGQFYLNAGFSLE